MKIALVAGMLRSLGHPGRPGFAKDRANPGYQGFFRGSIPNH